MQVARMDLNELSSLYSRDDMEFPSITPLKRTISPSKKVRVSSYYTRLKIVNRLLRFGDIWQKCGAVTAKILLFIGACVRAREREKWEMNASAQTH